MDTFSNNGIAAQLAEFETPFADVYAREEPAAGNRQSYAPESFLGDLESPFAQTFEAESQISQASPLAGDYVSLLGELHDSELPDVLEELAAELEDNWLNKISNELAMGETFIPYASNQAQEYFAPLIAGSEAMIDKIAAHYSGNNLADHSEAEIDQFFANFEMNDSRFSPVQEQFFGSVFKKVKSVVKKGVELAKKGISAVGKLLPVNVILNKLKGLIRPLLDKVLKFAIGKLPKTLQPHAKNLANKFLKLESADETANVSDETPATGNLDAVQMEFDTHIANLVFSGEDSEAEELVKSYEHSDEQQLREYEYETGAINLPSLEEGRQQFINDLKNLKEGESAAPAIERFLPVAIMALQPVIKMALSIIGRQKVINFLAGLLAKLVGKYVPENVAKPLAASIIDVGMSAIGFETFEANKADLAYEAIANTIQDAVRYMGELDEETLNDNEALTGQLLEAFENAAADNFPTQYIREQARKTSRPGLWVLKPRNGPAHYYKKYTQVFTAEITPQIAATLKTFKGAPIANFLRDKLGLDPGKTVQARVHLYEAIPGTRLSRINKFEKVPGLSQAHGAVQFHPLTVEAASLLCKEPSLGRNENKMASGKRHRTTVGQRFYYLEIAGARLRIIQNNKAPLVAGETMLTPLTGGSSKVASSSDVQAVINFVRSEIKINYYFSEEEARVVVEKLNRNDYLGAGINMSSSIRNVLNNMLLKNISNKVKIIHEAMPELFLENFNDPQEHFSFSDIRRGLSQVSLQPGKALLVSIISRLIDRLANLANSAVVTYLKARAAEFKQAQASPQDGVTLQITWSNIQGMSAIKAVINAVKNNFSISSLSGLTLPQVPAPAIKVSAGKNFD